MANKKDPALEKDMDFDDDFFSDLDRYDSDLDGLSVDTKEYDSENDRKPAGKLKSVTQDLSTVGRAAAGGAAAGIALKVRQGMPEVANVANQALDVVSDVSRLKNEVSQQIRPTINQTKILSRQLLKYTNDIVPTRVYNKLMEALDTPEEERDVAPSKEEARETAQSDELKKIFKIQMKEHAVDRQQSAVQKIIDQKMTQSRHAEVTGMVSDIRNQAFFQTTFIRSTFTAYMRKDLELKYRHMYIAEDTLEALRITSQMVEKRLDAIKHNTALPDSQKIHLTEILKRNTREKIMGGIQNSMMNYMSGVIGKVKENYVNPAMEMIGGGNDMMQGLLSMLEMQEDMGEKVSMKKSLLGGVGKFLGGSLGAMGGRKLLNKLSPEAKQVLSNHAKMGKQGIILLLEQLRRGEIDFEGSDTLSQFLDSILPEIDRTGGKFENEVYKDPNAASAITKRFTTTVEEIIPGYLSMQTALLKQIATGRQAEEVVYDFQTGDFVKSSTLNKKLYSQIYGSEEEKGAVLKGNADAVRKSLEFKGKTAQTSFEAVAKEVSIFMMNLANAKHWAKININSIREVSQTGEVNDEYAEIAFRGIKNPQEVATALLGMLTNSDGSVNEDVKSSLEVRIIQVMEEVSDRHRSRIYDAAFNFGYKRQMKDMLEADSDGNFVVSDSVRLKAFDSVTRQMVGEDYEYDLNSYGQKDKDKTALEKMIGAGKSSKILKTAASKVVKGIDTGLGAIASSIGKSDEYKELKVYLQTKFETLCAFLSSKKKGIKDFASDAKNAIIQKAYTWMKDKESFAPLVSVLFTEEGQLREDIPPAELANLLARIPKLHWLLYRIHKADNPIYYVLDSMLPASCIIVAEMSEEEIQTILQSANPEEELTEAVSESKTSGKKRSSKKKKKTDIPGKKKKADGGTIDIDHGEPIGTIDKPTLLAGGNALAGEHGAETIVPLNKTASAKEAYLQAKAYHEGQTFAEGGTVGPSGKKISSRVGDFIDESLAKGSDSLSAKIRSIKTDDVDADKELDHLADLLQRSGTVHTKEKLEKAQAAVEKAYDDLKNIDYKANFKQASASLIKFIRVVRQEGFIEQIPPADRRLLQRISESLKKKDFGLHEIRVISNKTTPVLKNAVKTYQEAYVRAEELKDKASEKAEELWGNAQEMFASGKQNLSDRLDDFKQTELYLKGADVVSRGKETAMRGLDKVKGFPSQVITTVTSLFKNEKGSIIEIAAEQLEIQKRILLQLQTGVVWGDKVDSVKIDNMIDLDPKKKKTGVKAKLAGAAGLLGKGVKKLAWDTPKSIVAGTYSNTFGAARHFLTNKKASVYRRPAAGQELGIDLLLISADDFTKGVFFDPEGKNPVKSVADINRPVFDDNGKMLITPSDIQQGLVDEKGKPLRTIGSRTGRLAHNLLGGSVDTATSLGKFAFDKVRENKLISKTADLAVTPYRIAKTFMQPWVDVYKKDQLDTPLVTAKDLKNGRLIFTDGKQIRDAYTINKPVMWVDTDENGEKKGTIAITWDDIQAGLVNNKNKPLNRFGNMAGSIARGALGLAGKGVNLIFKGYAGVIGIAKKITVAGIKGLFNKRNQFVDVYVPDNNGEIEIGKPKLTGANIKLGRYVFIDGKTVKSAYGIDRPVLDAETGSTLITEEDITRGLVDREGKKLTRFAGRSLFGKALAGAAGVVGWSAKNLFKGIKGIGKLVGKGASFLTKGIFDKGADIVAYMHGALNDILGTVFQRDTIKRKDLEEVVGDKLEDIYTLLYERLPKPEGGVLGDSDGDGDRDGSYQDYLQKQQARAEKNKKKQQEKALAKQNRGGAGAAGMLAAAGGGDDGGGLLDGAADAKATWDMLRGSKIRRGIGKAGRFLGGKIGTAGRFLGRGAMALGGKAVGALGGTAIGAKVMAGGAALKLGAGALAAKAGAAGAAILGGAGSAIAGGAAAAGSAIAGGAAALGGAAAAILSNPIGWVVGAGILAYAGYRLLKWAFTDSDETKNWNKTRHEVYGTNLDKQKGAVKDLEKRVLKAIDKKKGELSKEELEEFAEDFGLFSKGVRIGLLFGPRVGGDSEEEIKERMEYFTSWYATRFRPIYQVYVDRVRIATRKGPGDDVDPDDIDKERQDSTLELFKKDANRILNSSPEIKNLIPSKEGYEKYLKMKEEKKKAEEAPTQQSAAAAAIGGAAATTGEEKTDETKSGEGEKKEGSSAGAVAKKVAVASTGIFGMAFMAASKISEALSTGSIANLLSDPLKWATGSGILAFTGYKLLKWAFSDSEATKNWSALRHEYYGSDVEKQYRVIKKLEDRVIRVIEKDAYWFNNSELSQDELESFAEDFGLISKGYIFGLFGGDSEKVIKERMEYFSSWYSTRFRPIYEIYVSILRAASNTKPGDSLDPDDIPEEAQKLSQESFKKHAEQIINRNSVKNFVPSPEGYDAYLKMKEAREQASQKAQAATSSPQAQASLKAQAEAEKAKEALRKKEQEDDEKRYEDQKATKAAADAKLQAEVTATSQLTQRRQIDSRTDSGSAYASASRDTVYRPVAGTQVNASQLSQNVSSSAGDSASEYVAQQEKTSSVNVEGLKAANIPDGGSGDLGTYIKQFESGSRGSAAIGYDRTGGTSYGTYQFAAKVGGLQGFLKWLTQEGGDFGKKLASAMQSAGKLDTGSKAGEAPTVWKQFASVEGNPLGKLERNYIHKLYFQTALGKITDGKAKALVSSDRGLKEALWSTAVQHGAGGAAKIFNNTYKPDMTAADWLKAIYQKRGTQFGSSTPAVQRSVLNRYKAELPIVLGLSQSKSGQGSDSTTESTGNPAADKMIEGFNDTVSSSPQDAAASTAGVSGAADNQSGETSSGGGSTSGEQVALTGKEAAEGFGKLKKNKSDIDLNYGGQMKSALGKLNAAFMQKFGSPMLVTSGRRSLEKQAELYRKLGPGKAAKPNPKAPHIAGYAIDINTPDLNKAEKAGLLTQFGFNRPFWPKGVGRTPPESWHLELTGARQGQVDPNAPEPESTDGKEPTEEQLASKPDAVSPKEAEEAGAAPAAPTPASDNVMTPGGSATAEVPATSDSSPTEAPADAAKQLSESRQAASAAINETISSTSGDAAASTAGGNGVPSDIGASSSAGPSGSSGGTTNTSTTVSGSGGPTVETETPTQTGVVGSDITADAQLQELKLISQILSSIREDLKGYWGEGAQNKPTPNESQDQSSGMTTANGKPGETSADSVQSAVAAAFQPGSPAIQAIQSAVNGSESGGKSQTPVQNQPQPKGTDRTTIRQPINTSKQSYNDYGRFAITDL